jgi:hypothetical protein
VDRLGLENGWLQEIGAESTYRPDFERHGHPFETLRDLPATTCD